MIERTLDWQPRFDPRSLDYRVRALRPADAEMKGRNRLWKQTVWLDQGSEGACTGFAFAHAWGTTPRRKLFVTNETGRQRYYRARQEDEWPGENYEGSSILGVMEAARKDGLLKSYHWATTLSEIVYAVSYHGPLVIGVNWYTGMFDPNYSGFIEPTGQIEGGHAVTIGGINWLNRCFIIFNSWGQDWGVNGGAKIRFEDVNQLLWETGEFALPKKPVLPLW